MSKPNKKPPGCFIALMTADERVLTIVRGKGANNAGQYGLPGGRSGGEDVVSAAIRELEEELDLMVDVWGQPFLRLVHGRVNVILTLWSPTPEQASHVKAMIEGNLPNLEEVASVQWMSWFEMTLLPFEKTHKSLELLMLRFPKEPVRMLSIEPDCSMVSHFSEIDFS